MESFIDYIENTLQGERDDATLYHFKRQLLDKMTERANEITHSGLHDEKVLSDLIISEYPDLPGAYQKYRVAAKRERREKLVNKIMIFGTLALAFLLLVIYLTVSFLTDAWDKTWLIFAVGFLGWGIFLLSVGVHRISRLRRLFHPIARVLLALAVMCGASAIFLLVLVLVDWTKAWVLFPAGVIGIYLADAVFAYKTGQKLRIINYLVYILAASPMVYVFVCGLGLLPWDPGWLIIPLAVLVDVVLIIIKMAQNSKYKYRPEVDAAWNEN